MTSPAYQGYVRCLLCAFALLCLGACKAEPTVTIAGHTFQVEIADDPESQQLGLMFRDEMADDHGMVFIFKREQPRSFWMKNTRIPLDILYFDQHRRLVSMHTDVRPCRTERCPGYPSRKPAQYVLEINAGLAKELGITTGAEMTFSWQQD